MKSSVFSQFHEIIKDVKPLAERYLSDEANTLLESSRNKVDEKALTIQLYGAYNAGKSTLINVLLGENKAAVGEIPTTDKIDEFDWKGYKLLDSPGVNAPIEHEEVTLKQLEKTDLIVFIIRQDDQDVKDIYNRIFDCLGKKKHVFIVLNYNGLDPDSTGEGSVNLLVEQINKILIKEAKNRNSNDEFYKKISILPVNLNSALKGRLEEKQLLLKRSGYDAFVKQFSEWVISYDNEHHFVEAIKNYLTISLITPIKNLAEKNINPSIQQDLSREISKLKTQKNNLLSNSTSQLRNIVTSKKKVFFNELSSAQDEARARYIIEEYGSKIEQEFNDWFIGQSEEIQQQFTANIKSNSDIPFSEEDSNGHVSEHLSKVAIDTLKNPQLVEKGIVAGLTLLRANKIAFKGIWLKTFGKWAGKAAPIIFIATTLFEIHQAGKHEDEKNQQEKNAIMQLHGFIETISNEIISSLTDAVKTAITTIFSEAINQAENQLIQLNKNASEVEKDSSEIQRIIDRLQEISID
jgi:tRNA U34 5-carboxymethylaminomethyl modifying GTPase MnmE/TrmE